MAARQHVMADLVDGAIAGAVGTWLMGKTTSALYERENDVARQREDAARDGKSAYGVAAEKLAAAAGTELDDDARARYGSRLHWGLGMTAGAVFALVRPSLDRAGPARGAAFGTAFWALMDEGAVPALGLTPGPTAFPWQTHARGLAGHVVYGLAADAVLGLLGAGRRTSSETALVAMADTPAAVAATT